MALRSFMVSTGFVFAVLTQTQVLVKGEIAIDLGQRSFETSSSFSKALEILQKQIGYTFQHIDLLRRAMTHPSFSEENNRALSMLGASLIETSTSLRYLKEDIDISTEDLSNHVTEVSKVETSCAKDGTKLHLQNFVRVSRKTNSSTPSVVCGAFRAIFGAVALDTGKSDDAGGVFWAVHGGKTGTALPTSER